MEIKRRLNKARTTNILSDHHRFSCIKLNRVEFVANNLIVVGTLKSVKQIFRTTLAEKILIISPTLISSRTLS